MRILISGSTGLIGSNLFVHLMEKGHDVVPLKRSSKLEGVYWNPKSLELRKEDFEGFDAIIHLAGKNITGGLWTKKFKEEILQSRVRDTQLLSEVIASLKTPPKTLIVASAVGYYGNRFEEVLTEESDKGKGFLANVCQKWEEATSSAEKKGVRTVRTRFGLVLSPKGGALKRLLTQFRFGLGAVLGSGEQYLSWVALDDVLGAMDFILLNDKIDGAVNITSPYPEKMKDFSEKLANYLHRPLFLKMGKRVLKCILGEMAEEMILTSVRAIPKKLRENGYSFQFERVESYFDSL